MARVSETSWSVPKAAGSRFCNVRQPAASCKIALPEEFRGGGSMRILVVEDDAELGSQLQKGLREQGFAVDRVEHARAGLSQAVSGVYDLMIFDRMLPGGDGVDLLTQVRAAGVSSPVIFLTARGEVADRICGLDAGA